MAWVFQDTALGLQRVTDTDTTANVPPGYVARAVDPTLGHAEFIYVKGAASLVAGDWVNFSNYGANFAVTRANMAAVSNNTFSVGVAAAAINATSYGWVQISGQAIANTTGSTTAGDVQYGNTTSQTKTAQVNGTQVLGAIVTLANGSAIGNGTTLTANQSLVFIDHPKRQGQIV